MLGMLLVMGTTAYSQDPHFSQFFAAPATVNPAYTGVFDGVARINTNFRQQWTNLGSPYTTGFASFDLKTGHPLWKTQINTYVKNMTMRGQSSFVSFGDERRSSTSSIFAFSRKEINSLQINIVFSC
ncbi:type IX secretion system membrane protein PorP/SprF [bacterium]|nr:type IX secretion system membrane protein PorP/SprF [Candidatus Elulimicrobium humile]